jgi:uncharacterized protein YbcV (DUF1398 family)
VDINIINECAASSLANTMNFPAVIHKLISAGTERYITDLAGLKKNYYGNQGETYFTSLDFPAGEVAATFDETAVRHALHAIQKNDIDYQTFLKRIMHAGCCHYEVFIRGKKVIYFGRDGSQYVEFFPGQKL